MTDNKRFVNMGNEIYLNGEWWCSAGGEHCADVIATALNELIDDNEYLKQEIERNISSFKENNRKRLELEKENKELEKENESLRRELYNCEELIII